MLKQKRAGLLLTFIAAALCSSQALESAFKSSYNCSSAAPGLRTCILSNVVLWKGKVYLSSSETLEAPSVRLDYFASVDLKEQDSELKNWVQVSKPEQLPFNSSAIPKRYASAALFKRVHVANWFHTFTEDGANLFNLFCSYLGLCSYAAFHEPNKAVAVFTLDVAGLAGGNFADVMACYGDTVVLRDVPDAPILVERLLVGVGDHCNPTHCFQNHGGKMQPLSTEIITGWVHHMRQCAGLAQEPSWHKGNLLPRVLFVNRAVSSGRSVLPMGQVFSHFSAPERNASATFSLRFLEDMHWKQAAALFDQADIVISPHGAQTSQALFLPLHSQFVHLDNSPSHAQLTAWVIDNVGAYLHIEQDHLACKQDTETVVAVEAFLQAYHGFDAYSLPDLKRIIMEHSCPGDTHADCPDYNTFSRFLNYAPPKDALIAKVDAAIQQWHAFRQLQEILHILSVRVDAAIQRWHAFRQLQAPANASTNASQAEAGQQHRHHVHGLVKPSHRRMLGQEEQPATPIRLPQHRPSAASHLPQQQLSEAVALGLLQHQLGLGVNRLPGHANRAEAAAGSGAGSGHEGEGKGEVALGQVLAGRRLHAGIQDVQEGRLSLGAPSSTLLASVGRVLSTVQQQVWAGVAGCQGFARGRFLAPRGQL